MTLEARARELDWQAAAKQVDWMQILLNLMNRQETGRDGQPCLFIGGGRFCGRAKFWAGHDDQHKFASLLDLLTRVQAEARLAALEEAARWLELNHRDDEDEQWEACCNLPDKIRALAQAAAPAKETK